MPAANPLSRPRRRPNPGSDCQRIKLPASVSFPEGIAYDAEAGVLYTGGAADGAIARVNVASGRVDVVAEAGAVVPAGTTAFPAMLGMEIDAAKRLWVVGGRTGKAWVVSTTDGRVIKDVTVPSVGKSLLNDVAIVGPSAFITDTFVPTLWRMTVAGDTIGNIEPWLDLRGTPIVYGEGAQLNGITVTPDGQTLIVVQMAKGLLFTIDIPSKVVKAIDTGGEDLSGADGLVLDGDTLYVVRQTAVEIATVVLSDGMTRGRVVSRFKDPGLAWPATAVKVGEALIVVNTQFDSGSRTRRRTRSRSCACRCLGSRESRGTVTSPDTRGLIARGTVEVRAGDRRSAAWDSRSTGSARARCRCRCPGGCRVAVGGRWASVVRRRRARARRGRESPRSRSGRTGPMSSSTAARPAHRRRHPAAKLGKTVVIVCPDKHLGGLTSGGLGLTDTGNKAVIGGLSREFYHRVWQHYQQPEAWTLAEARGVRQQGPGHAGHRRHARAPCGSSSRTSPSRSSRSSCGSTQIPVRPRRVARPRQGRDEDGRPHRVDHDARGPRPTPGGCSSTPPTKATSWRPRASTTTSAARPRQPTARNGTACRPACSTTGITSAC